MRCSKIQRLILSDHADGELDERSRKLVEDHIRTCARCRELEQRLRETVTEPLRETGHIQPPEHLWASIKSTIEEGRESPFEEIKELLRVPLIARKPALALASAAILLLVAGFFAGSFFIEKERTDEYFEEQLDFLDSLNNGNGYKYKDIGIPMEDLFL